MNHITQILKNYNKKVNLKLETGERRLLNVI